MWLEDLVAAPPTHAMLLHVSLYALVLTTRSLLCPLLAPPTILVLLDHANSFAYEKQSGIASPELSKMGSSTAKVFGTIELLENVLSFVDGKTLLKAYCASMRFRSVIEASPRLRKRAHCEAWSLWEMRTFRDAHSKRNEDIYGGYGMPGLMSMTFPSS